MHISEPNPYPAPVLPSRSPPCFPSCPSPKTTRMSTPLLSLSLSLALTINVLSPLSDKASAILLTLCFPHTAFCTLHTPACIKQAKEILLRYKLVLRLRSKGSRSKIDMVEEKVFPSSPSSSSAAVASCSPSSRWNPTKDQISILEGLYRQGIRTPTAEQIQQITGKLREFGAIEGKNVFYWFQNHKARQRQKQKQESFAYFSRLLRRQPPPPLTPTPAVAISCSNVVCAPFCLQMPQVSGVGLYHPQYPDLNYLAGEAAKQRPLPEQLSRNKSSYETLQLFPLHPTGVSEEKTGGSVNFASMETECEGDENEEGGDDEGLPFFNFFDGEQS